MAVVTGASRKAFGSRRPAPNSSIFSSTKNATTARGNTSEKRVIAGFAFEALLLSVDTPELSPDEVLNACRDQAEAIQRSIRSAMETYRGEAKIADDLVLAAEHHRNFESVF